MERLYRLYQLLHRSGASSNISAIRNAEEINISTEYAFNDIFNMSEDDLGSSGDIPNRAESKDSIAPPTSESMSRWGTGESQSPMEISPEREARWSAFTLLHIIAYFTFI